MRFLKFTQHLYKKYPKREFISDLVKLIFYLFHISFSQEFRVYSQNGEDGILDFIFAKIGTTNNIFVEFGVGDGTENNTRFLKEYKGWQGLWMDEKHKTDLIKKEHVTRTNIERLFKKYKIPKKFDLLSIDIDGNDYWVWQSIKHYKPRVVVIEYNAAIPWNESKTIRYNPRFVKGDTDYFGASLLALKNLGEKKGYRLVYCDSKGVNAFFVLEKEARRRFPKKSIQKLYRPFRYAPYKKDKRPMVNV